MDKKSGKPSQKRRAILQGSLAAPVVLSVSSPTSVQASSLGRCLQNDRLAQPAFFEGSTPDTWLRDTVAVIQLKYQGGALDWYYLDPNPNQNTYIKLSTMQRMTFGSNLDSGWSAHGTASRRALVWVSSTSGEQYTLMQVDKPTGFQAATMSCMTSFNRGAG
jgi:hypothetical protein